MIEAVRDNNLYLVEIMDSLYRLGDVTEDLYSRCPDEALYIAEGIRLVTSAARKYELTLSDPAASFADRRPASQHLSQAITDLRYRLHECYERAPAKTQEIFGLMLDETLHSLWDPHIQHDIETYTKDQITNAFEALLAPISALDDYVGWIRRRVDDLSDNITILEARVEENGAALRDLKRRIHSDGEDREARGLADEFFIPVIMESRHRREEPPKRKRPVLTVIK